MEFKSCLLRFVQVVDVSMSHGGCDLLTVTDCAWPGVAVVSDALMVFAGAV